MSAVELPVGTAATYHEWIAAKDAVKQWQAEVERLSGLLIPHLEVAPGEWADTATLDGAPALHYIEINTTRLDTKKLRENWPQVYDQFAHTTTHHRLTVAS